MQREPNDHGESPPRRDAEQDFVAEGAKCRPGELASSGRLQSEPSAPSSDQRAQLIGLYQGGHYAEMEILARDLVRQYRQSGYAWKALGAALQAQKKEALAVLHTTTLLRPDDAEAHSNLGVEWQSQGQLDNAIVSYRRALALKPDYATAHTNLGALLKERGQLDDAVASYRRALDLKPDFAEAHNNMGLALYELDQPDAAAASYRRALTLRPDFAEAHNNLGAVLNDLGQPDAAVASYRQALAINPDFAEALNNLGVALKDLGRLADAVASCRRAEALNPACAQTYTNLGDLLAYAGEVEQEIMAYQKAFALAPEDIGLNAAAMLAIHHYLAADFPACKAMLAASSAIVARTEAKYAPARAYWILVDLLIAWHARMGAMADPGPNRPPLYVIGESHSLPAHGVDVVYRGCAMRCAARWIVGCKQWHLGNAAANVYKHQFEKIMAQLPRRSTVLMMIGEIDCRHDEGIVEVWRKSPKQSLAAICRATSGAYLRYVAAIGAHYGHRLVVAGVPAPNIMAAPMVGETAERHTRLIQTFNDSLRDLVQAVGLDFLDLFALTDRGDGVATGQWHIDSNHLLPSAVMAAFDKFCRWHDGA